MRAREVDTVLNYWTMDPKVAEQAAVDEAEWAAKLAAEQVKVATLRKRLAELKRTAAR